MVFDDFLKQIPKIKNSNLPGIDSQFKMAPAIRKNLGKNFDIASRNPKTSAVLALLYPKNKQVYMAFILRKTYKGVHSNQIGFPGGKTEKEDKNDADTALRETYEEIGVPPTDITIVKQLTDIYIPPSNFIVKPFLGYVSKTPTFTLEEKEVSALIEVPLSELINEAHVGTKVITTSYAKNLDVPVYTFTTPVLWGATAMMVSEIKDLIRLI